MRTTVTIADELLARLRKEAAKRGCSVSRVIEDAVRMALATGGGSPEELPFRLATLGGAEALGLGAETGSLEPGKSADLIAVDLSGPHLTPSYDPEVAMVASATGRDVVLAMVEGRILYRDGKVTTLDEDSLRGRLAESSRKVSS